MSSHFPMLTPERIAILNSISEVVEKYYFAFKEHRNDHWLLLYLREEIKNRVNAAKNDDFTKHLWQGVVNGSHELARKKRRQTWKELTPRGRTFFALEKFTHSFEKVSEYINFSSVPLMNIVMLRNIAETIDVFQLNTPQAKHFAITMSHAIADQDGYSPEEKTSAFKTARNLAMDDKKLAEKGGNERIRTKIQNILRLEAYLLRVSPRHNL